MKERIRRIGRHCFRVMGSPVMLISIIICCCVFSSFLFSAIRNLALWKHMVTLPEPAHCALCADDGVVNTYPCLVRLETGQVGQIDVYDIGAEYLQEIIQFQETGVYTTFSFVLGGLVENTATEAHSSTSTVNIPKEALHIDPKLFCHDCRARIGEAIDGAALYTTGYVLADLYDLNNIRIYPIEEDAKYNIQGYTVEISKDKKTKELVVSVTGYFNL